MGAVLGPLLEILGPAPKFGHSLLSFGLDALGGPFKAFNTQPLPLLQQILAPGGHAPKPPNTVKAAAPTGHTGVSAAAPGLGSATAGSKPNVFPWTTGASGGSSAPAVSGTPVTKPDAAVI